MRLLTRSDFDGLACAALLTEVGVVTEYHFVHPRDVQNGSIPVNANDVLANVPYSKGCGLWFDHHTSETERLTNQQLKFDGVSKPSPSAAQLIWEYYGGESVFGKFFNPLLKAVNKTDSADLRLDEVLYAEGWVLLNFIIDPRTGLDNYTFFRIDKEQFIIELIGYIRKMAIDEILQQPDVAERITLYNSEQKRHKDMLNHFTKIHKNLIIVNLLEADPIYAGNRFISFARHPKQNVELRLSWDSDKKNVIVNCGHSIFNRSCKIDVGRLMLQLGGGGHARVGSCTVPAEKWSAVYKELVNRLITT